MTSIQECEIPQGALLGKYRSNGGYADCYVTLAACKVSQAEYVEAFYTTRVFKLERLLLAWALSRSREQRKQAQMISMSVVLRPDGTA